MGGVARPQSADLSVRQRRANVVAGIRAFAPNDAIRSGWRHRDQRAEDVGRQVWEVVGEGFEESSL
jgi:hypothetical protein